MTGDLNAFEEETPLQQLQTSSATLRNLWPQVPGQEAYSFPFSGLLQALDHVLVSDGLDQFVASIRYAHIDTDYASRSDGHSVSDHNPLVLTLNANVPPPPVIAKAPLAVLPFSGLFFIGLTALSIPSEARRQEA